MPDSISSGHQSARTASTFGPNTTSASTAAILSSAAGYGGMAARGIAAGLRKGAEMAQRAQRPEMKLSSNATADRLAKSAPVEGSFLVDPDAGEHGTDDIDTEEYNSSARTRTSRPPTQERSRRPLIRWIKIVDFPRDRVIALFQLPPAGSYSGMLSPDHRYAGTVSFLSFSPNGTQLLAAQADGRACHVVQIHPTAAGAERRGAKDVHGEVYHMYELKRGNTPAEIKDVVWDARGRWLGVVSGQGTIRASLLLHFRRALLTGDRCLPCPPLRCRSVRRFSSRQPTRKPLAYRSTIHTYIYCRPVTLARHSNRQVWRCTGHGPLLCTPC